MSIRIIRTSKFGVYSLNVEDDKSVMNKVPTTPTKDIKTVADTPSSDLLLSRPVKTPKSSKLKTGILGKGNLEAELEKVSDFHDDTTVTDESS